MGFSLTIDLILMLIGITIRIMIQNFLTEVRLGQAPVFKILGDDSYYEPDQTDRQTYYLLRSGNRMERGNRMVRSG